MSEECKHIWNNCLARIKKEIGTGQSFNTWFKPIKPYKYENNTLTIRVPSQFFYEWLESHYIHLLQHVVHQEIGPQGRLSYQLDQKKKIPPPLRTTQQVTKKPTRNEALPTSIHLNPLFTFANFIEGDCNQIARAAAESIAQNPGKTAFNPFMIHGDTGLGKTHLVQAIAHHVQQHHPYKKILYITTEKFTAQLIQKIRENKTHTFVQAYSNLDLIIVDDIQFLGGKEKTQEIFFHIFNHLCQINKQVIMTSDVPPSDLQGFQDRILSRFRAGLTTDLTPPDLETRIAIIYSKLAQQQFTLPEDIIHYLASQITANLAELQGILTSLIAHADLKKKPITKPLVKKIIQSVVGEKQTTRQIKMPLLQNIITNHFNISLPQFKSKKRTKDLVKARQIFMYLTRKYTRHSLKAIAEFIGFKDHSTVSYALTTIQKAIQNKPLIRTAVEDIIKTINKSTL
ncbi:MAG: chromosomal replication initiator protein DnaA [Bacteroidota bacterium]